MSLEPETEKRLTRWIDAARCMQELLAEKVDYDTLCDVAREIQSLRAENAQLKGQHAKFIKEFDRLKADAYELHHTIVYLPGEDLQQVIRYGYWSGWDACWSKIRAILNEETA